MKQLLALIGARNKEFYRDRAALIWTFLFPFIVLAGFAFGSSGQQQPLLRVRVAPAAALAGPALAALKDAPAVEVLGTDDAAGALAKLGRHQLDLVVEELAADRLAYSLSPDSEKGRLAERLLRDAVRAELGRATLEARPVPGRPIRYADWLLPGLISMNLMFGSMFGVGYVVVRYRKNGVLKRLRATPLTALQFLAAQVLSRMMIMVATSFLVVGGSMLLIGFRPQGSWLALAGFVAVSAMAMISLGLVVASRIATEEVADGVLNLMTWPMIFLSGVWFSIDGASPWVVLVSKALPLTHVVDGLRAILIEGAGLEQLGPQLAVLSVLSLVFLAIGAAIFRWR